jgi:hypothetical protein
VDHVDHARVGGLTVIGVRGMTRRARVAGGYRARLTVVVGVLTGVVLGNGVHCAGGMTARAIGHAASSRSRLTSPSVATAGGQRPVPDVVTVAHQVTARSAPISHT